jgi:3-oxoacyl-[acyl-carrier protein] reductase
MDWHREVAVVTGGTRGIGWALALGLARRGAAVAVCARDPQAAEHAAAELRGAGPRALGAGCDVRDEASVATFAERVLRELGTPTLLVNNAGIGRFAAVAEMSLAAWDEVIDTNLRGTFLVTRAFLPAMIAARRGAVVNVASLAGRNGIAEGAAYSASKHGVLGFSKSLMLEVRKAGIRVMAVCPGSVNTAFFDGDTPFDPNRSRILLPEDVAKATLDALELPERALVSELDIRPANP